MIADSKELVAGIDIGGTKTNMMISDKNGALLVKKRLPTVITPAPEEFFGRLFEEADKLAAECGGSISSLCGMGVGFPGVIDPSGVLSNAPAFPWQGANVENEIRRYYGGALYLDNDVNMAALGENWKGAARGINDFLMITVGTGIGGALFLNGRLYRGASSAAGEMGYFINIGNGAPGAGPE